MNPLDLHTLDQKSLSFLNLIGQAPDPATTANLALKANIASPTFTGDPKAPTPSAGDNDTSIATTAFVATSFAPLASPVFTGNPTGPTPSVDDNDTSIATTAYVIAQSGTSNPLINGTAGPGSSLRYSRQDHIHPTDTTRMPLTPSFTSSDQSITTNTDTAVAHGLGRVPDLFLPCLKCTSSELGYTTGDIVLHFGRGYDGSTSHGIEVYANSTNVGFVIFDIPAILKRSATVGTPTVITAANWKVVLKAW